MLFMMTMLIVILMLMVLMIVVHGDVNVNDINDDSSINLGGSEGEYNVGEISWKRGVM